MGQGRDMLNDPDPEVIRNYKNHWVTKSNEKLLISDMGTEHISNCIKMVEKHKDAKKELKYLRCYETLKNELKKRSGKIFKKEFDSEGAMMGAGHDGYGRIG